MDPTITASIIGGACTLVAGIGGAFIGKSQRFDKIFRKKNIPNFVGTKWESSWIENDQQENKARKEYFEFIKKSGNNIYGNIRSDIFPDMK